MLEYLDGANNWELYKAIERGCQLYNMKSSNIVEIFYNSIKEARTYSNPFFFLKAALLKNIERTSILYESSMKVISENCGLTPR